MREAVPVPHGRPARPAVAARRRAASRGRSRSSSSVADRLERIDHAPATARPRSRSGAPGGRDRARPRTSRHCVRTRPTPARSWSGTAVPPTSTDMASQLLGRAGGPPRRRPGRTRSGHGSTGSATTGTGRWWRRRTGRERPRMRPVISSRTPRAMVWAERSGNGKMLVGPVVEQQGRRARNRSSAASAAPAAWNVMSIRSRTAPSRASSSASASAGPVRRSGRISPRSWRTDGPDQERSGARELDRRGGRPPWCGRRRTRITAGLCNPFQTVNHSPEPLAVERTPRRPPPPGPSRGPNSITMAMWRARSRRTQGADVATFGRQADGVVAQPGELRVGGVGAHGLQRHDGRHPLVELAGRRAMTAGMP